MKRVISIRAFAAVAFVSTCFGATAASAQQSATGATRLYLSNGRNVAIFSVNNLAPGAPTATLATSEAEGLAIGRDGQLFVAQQQHADVAVFNTTSLRQTTLLHDPGQQPTSIAIGSTGTVYVGNALSGRGGPGSVSVYEHGSIYPNKTLSCPSFYEVEGVAVDARGDVFVNQNKAMSGGGEVDVVAAGSNACRVLSLSEYSAGGAAIDPATNDLLLADQGDREILIVAPPYRSVTSTIALPRCTGHQVLNIALDPTASLLYTSDPAYGADVLAYPGGGIEATYTLSAPLGIAISG